VVQVQSGLRPNFCTLIWGTLTNVDSKKNFAIAFFDSFLLSRSFIQNYDNFCKDTPVPCTLTPPGSITRTFLKRPVSPKFRPIDTGATKKPGDKISNYKTVNSSFVPVNGLKV